MFKPSRGRGGSERTTITFVERVYLVGSFHSLHRLLGSFLWDIAQVHIHIRARRDSVAISSGTSPHGSNLCPAG